MKKESDYSEENICENEVFCSTILHLRKKQVEAGGCDQVVEYF